MSVYLGYNGSVEIDRESAEDAAYRTVLDPSDVNVAKRRFSVDFNVGVLITGDRVEIATVDGSDLQLVAGHDYPDGTWYVHIDDAGGIRLYETFQPSLSGGPEGAVALIEPSAPQDITLQTKNDRFRCLAKVRDFELTTSRETIDLTSLGSDFRKQYEQGLISGQGTLNCFWASQLSGACEEVDGTPSQVEFPSYLARLVIRVKQGAAFNGRFFIYSGTLDQPESVWYECRCVVTNVAVTVSVDGVIETRIDFVTTDDIVLKQGRPPGYLLQEDGEFLLQENGDRLLLED
nr:hypothetical protein 11 [bacterium]